MRDLVAERRSQKELDREADLLRLVPKNRETILDIGARDGHFSNLLTRYFPRVTALDLQKPRFSYPGVTTVAGDVTRLDFPDNSFDCIFCAEVLEHIPALEQACREIQRVAKYEILIGVPYRQDTRVGRMTCRSCGKIGPAYGHVNEFDEQKLDRLFSACTVIERSFVGLNRQVTNPLSMWAMDLAGNPWAPYDQDEPCIHCGAAFTAPPPRSIGGKILSAVALRISQAQSRFVRPHGNKVHTLYRKNA